MNPDKLFDYLDGKLPDWERTQLEEDLASDPQLQRELTVARRIHSSMRGDSREVLVQDDAVANARGRKMALRVGTAFIILMGVNVAAGLWVIARHEAGNPNRKLLETQMREQVTRSIEQASNAALTPPPLGVNEITVSVAPGELNRVADQVISTAQRLGGTATKGLPEANHVGVLVEVPANRDGEFRAAISAMTGGVPTSPAPETTGTSASDRKSFIVQIMESISH
jgi:hypothetical protein